MKVHLRTSEWVGKKQVLSRGAMELARIVAS